MPLPAPLPLARLEQLARLHGTPFQLYDERLMRANCRALLRAFSPARFPQGFRQFFAVKALPNPAVLRVLVSEGCGLDCSSVSELHIARALGLRGEEVMYTGNYNSPADLGYAFDIGCVMNLDDASLVDSLVRARGRVPDLVCFRLNPGLGRTDSETKSNVLGGPSAKFGVPPDQIVDAYRRARAAGATRFGMHMMTGSCVMNAAYWDETVTALLAAVQTVRAALPGLEFEFVNIGGGLGIPYQPGQPTVDVEALAAQLQACVDARWAEIVRAASAAGARAPPARPPRLCMENGRYMTGPFGWLVARCEARKEAFGSSYFGLDACMSNLMRPGMYGAYHHITVRAGKGG
jgi:diaminopimelate decarboxylase